MSFGIENNFKKREKIHLKHNDRILFSEMNRQTSNKSIRLQIELPIEYQQSLARGNGVHVHIRFDNEPKPTSQTIKNSSFIELNSSGISLDASSSSGHSSDFDYKPAANNCKPKNQAVYNRLSDNRFQVPLIKSDEHIEECDENIYEDVSSFLESSGYVKPVNKSVTAVENKVMIVFLIHLKYFKYRNFIFKSCHLYESLDAQNQSSTQQRFTTAEKVAINRVRRNYELNEIFENLKRFKQQAKSQETLARRNVNECDRITENQDKHVYINQRTKYSTAL